MNQLVFDPPLTNNNLEHGLLLIKMLVDFKNANGL